MTLSDPEREAICLTPLHHFHPFHRHLDISEKQNKKQVASLCFQVGSLKKEDLTM